MFKEKPRKYKWIFDININNLKKKDWTINGEEPRIFKNLGNGSYYLGNPKDWDHE